MRSRWFWPFLVLCILFSDWAHGQMMGLGEGNRFEFEARFWRPKFRSELEVGGPMIDATSELGVEDEKVQEYRGFLRLGRWMKVRGSGFKTDYRGLNTVSQDVTFSDVTFPEGTEVLTTMTFEHLKGGVEVDIFALEEGFFAVVAEYSSFKAKPVSLSSSDADAEETLDVALLTVGLKGRIYLTPGLALTAEATGMKKDDSGVITDFEGSAIYNLSRNIGVSFGYRNLYVKWLKGGRATFRMEGYFFSGIIRF
jgi:hypothetical protein